VGRRGHHGDHKACGAKDANLVDVRGAIERQGQARAGNLLEQVHGHVDTSFGGDQFPTVKKLGSRKKLFKRRQTDFFSGIGSLPRAPSLDARTDGGPQKKEGDAAGDLQRVTCPAGEKAKHVFDVHAAFL